jgi:hypothetical protein
MFDRVRSPATGWRSPHLLLAACLILTALSGPSLAAESFDGPTFRKGMWKFVRTLDLIVHAQARHRVLRQESIRCVDPTESMRGTFSSAPVGACVSAKPEKHSNRYVFAKRCDYLGPVSTVITVDSDEAYSELNQVIEGAVPKADFVSAQRIGDCPGDGARDVLSQ